MNEVCTPIGSQVLVRPAKKIEVKTQGNLVIPDGQGGARRAKSPQKEIKAAEFTIVSVAEGRDETEVPLVKDLRPGMRIAVGNTQLVPVYVNGEQLLLMDALHIVAILTRDDS